MSRRWARRLEVLRRIADGEIDDEEEINRLMAVAESEDKAEPASMVFLHKSERAET